MRPAFTYIRHIEYYQPLGFGLDLHQDQNGRLWICKWACDAEVENDPGSMDLWYFVPTDEQAIQAYVSKKIDLYELVNGFAGETVWVNIDSFWFSLPARQIPENWLPRPDAGSFYND